jgi:hypothetical protein
MERDRGGTDWISAFLEWTFNESERAWADLRAHDDAVLASEGDEEIAEAYLEWIDASPIAAAVAASNFGIDRRGVRGGTDMLNLSRESILLMALRTEADCVHMLRQVLEMDGAGAGNLRLAIEGLEDAQRLLDGEQRAWHALMDVREAGWAMPERLLPAGFDQEWPIALDCVAAEVRALTGKVLAMHPH